MPVLRTKRPTDRVAEFFRQTFKRAGDRRLREAAVLDLVRQRTISAAKGTELLDMYVGDFLDLMGQHQIPYFTEGLQSLRKLRTLRKTLVSQEV